jgi:hypothetical protein
LLIILLVAIGPYSIGAYSIVDDWCLFYWWLLMAIGYFSISDY